MFEGRILPVTVKLGAPILVGSGVQLVYAIADTYFISRIDPSSTALLSGTGLMFPVFFFIMATAGSLSVGVATLVGRAVGERNQDALRHTAPSGLLLCTVIVLPLIACGYLFGDRLVRLLAGGKMSPEALGYGLTFFHYLVPGLAVMVLLHVLMGILQGQGLTKLIATAAVLSTVVNIMLDPIFIFTLKMGVAGAGCATSIAVTCAAAFVVAAFLRGKSAVPLRPNVFEARSALVKEILRIGLPNFLSMASMSVSFMVFNKLVSAIGEDAMNAYTLAGRMDQAVLIPSFAVAGATSIMISQNYGRNQLDRVRRIFHRNVLLGVTVVAIAACLYMAVAPLLFGAFSTVGPVVAAASRQVRLLALTFIGVSVAIVCASTFQATGRPMPALVLSLVRMGVVSLPIAFTLELWLGAGMNGVYIALAAGNLVAVPLALFWVRRHLDALKFRSVI